MHIPDLYTLPDIDFVGGSTQDLLFRCYFYLNKRPFDLSYCTANFALIDYVNRNGQPLLTKSMAIRKEAVDGEVINYILTVTLNPSDTLNLVGKYIYQITIRESSGSIEIPNQGLIHIANNINKSFIR